MISNYFRIAWRNIQKHKAFSFINIIGLAIGLTCFMFIAVFVYDELNYDRYPANAKDIYRVHLSVTGNGNIEVYPNVDFAVGPGMQAAIPEIKTITRISPATDFVKSDDQQFKEKKLGFAESNFFQFFSLPLLEGNTATALAEPNSMVVTKDFAKKYFGNGEAVGKSLQVGINNAVYKITGVMDKMPDQSHFHFDALLSLSTFHITNPTWSNLGPFTYVQLNPNANPKTVEPKFRDLVAKYVVPEVQHDMGVSLAEAQKSVNTFVFSLQPLEKIHLYSDTKYELETNSDIKYVYIFSALALFILLLACVNFTNLSSAKAVKRAREVGIRKVLGSIRKQLIVQFLSESVLFGILSMLCAYVLLLLLLPYFNQLSHSTINYSFFFGYRPILFLLAVSLTSGILAGIYPAFFLSSFNTIKVLKGVSITGLQGKSLRSGLIVFQFIVSTALIIATIIVYQQLHYMQNRKLGYDKNQVLFLPDARLLGTNQQAFKQQLLQDRRVVSASISRSIPGGDIMDGTEIYPKNGNSNGAEIHTNIFHVDYDYLSTLGIKIISGRNFSRAMQTDSASGIVINEAAVRALGWTNATAVGKSIVRSGQQEYTVIGVVADFNYATLKQAVAPMMMRLGGNNGGLIIKVATADIQNFLKDLKTNWDNFKPAAPIEYNFLDEKFAALYASEKNTQQIFSAFAVLAIIIACLGLFGLSAFVIEQRTKEIGIRKVLGASAPQVLVLVSKEFLLLVGIAFAIAIPVTAWAMNAWLQDFAFRIHINALAFIITAAIVVSIAVLTVSAQALKAAFSNPVKSLRTE